jgi:5-methylcytosine-specific restriction endonuclease McrA
MSKILEEHVLVLNKHWMPIGACTVAEAFSRLVGGMGRFLDHEDYSLNDFESWIDKKPVDGRVVRTSWLEIRVPEIMILRSGKMPEIRQMAFSRRNLLRRDRHTCQYCGQKPTPRHLTIDHVLPRRRGGKSSWENCVISCVTCNRKKADRLLSEAGMSLLPRPELKGLFPDNPSRWNMPYQPAWSPIFKVNPDYIRPAWRSFVGDIGGKFEPCVPR